MSSFIRTFLKSEVTCIPGEINKIVGDYYNNAHCNGATWLFVLWNILRYLYDKCLYALLRRLKFKQHLCWKLQNSLWYLGFFGTAFAYSSATLVRDEMELFNFKRMNVRADISLPYHVMLGYTLICTFYLHAALWEGLKNGSGTSFLKFLSLALLCMFSYILRILEIVFTLTGLIGLSVVFNEVTKLSYVVFKRENLISQIFVSSLFIVSLALFALLYVVVIPLTFVIPLGLKILSDYPNLILIFLYFSLLVWLMMEVYKSILFRLFDHWLYHSKDVCTSDIIECSLFPSRNDDAYHLEVFRSEMKERQQEMVAKRKPKNRSMLVQTLKCMVAIKRKLSEKRTSESSDSDDSEKSEDNLLKKEGAPEETSEDEKSSDDEVSPEEIVSSSEVTSNDQRNTRSENRDVEGAADVPVCPETSSKLDKNLEVKDKNVKETETDVIEFKDESVEFSQGDIAKED